MRDDAGVLAGTAPRVAEAKLLVARGVLAVRRGDRLAAEAFMVNAQRVLTAIEIGLGSTERKGD